MTLCTRIAYPNAYSGFETLACFFERIARSKRSRKFRYPAPKSAIIGVLENANVCQSLPAFFKMLFMIPIGTSRFIR